MELLQRIYGRFLARSLKAKIIISVGTLISCCCGLLTIQGLITTSSPEWQATATAEAAIEQVTETAEASLSMTQTAMPTSTLPPTNTSTITNTPEPTDTPKPTNTPAPTGTATSTQTPVPTSTPRPTNTPRPTPLPTATYAGCDCSGDVYNCDSNIPGGARACYNYCYDQGVGDIHNLDGDGDGRFCEG